MARLDPRTPVLVGAAQLTRRAADGTGSAPVEMMSEVVRLAADDAAAPSLVGRADSVRVVDVFSWRYENPAHLLAAALGASPRQHVSSTTGGNSPQMLLNDAARAIAGGELDVVVIAGAEAMYTRRIARKRGIELDWPSGSGDEADERMGTDRNGSHPAELARGVAVPTQLYPVFENALRAAEGRPVDEHLQRIGRLWSGFSAVAASNPYAWQPEDLSPTEIVTPSPDNRMVSFPYTKLLCANMQVDQAAALVVCSAEAAEAAGVSRDQWVFPWSGADANEEWFVSERHDLHSSRAIRACGETALRLAGIGTDDVSHFDLYSCFTSAVEVAANELGLDLFDERGLTVTGGLVFGGGPGNNYVTHSIAAMVERLRGEGGIGLVTANGWFLTKHAVGIYGAEPPPGGFKWESPQGVVDAGPRREAVESHDGDVTLEAFTVTYDRDGSPATAFVACLLDSGARTWATSSDATVMKALETEDLIGSRAHVSGGTLSL